MLMRGFVVAARKPLTVQSLDSRLEENWESQFQPIWDFNDGVIYSMKTIRSGVIANGTKLMKRSSESSAPSSPVPNELGVGL